MDVQELLRMRDAMASGFGFRLMQGWDSRTGKPSHEGKGCSERSAALPR
jgi:hypothetical protein